MKHFYLNATLNTHDLSVTSQAEPPFILSPGSPLSLTSQMPALLFSGLLCQPAQKPFTIKNW